jgi:hypothetical protein
MRLLLAIVAGLLVTTVHGTVVPIINDATGSELDLVQILNNATGNLGLYHDTGLSIDNQLTDKAFEQCSAGLVTLTVLDQQAGHEDYHRVGFYQPAGTTPIGAPPTYTLAGVTFLAGDLDSDPLTAITPAGAATIAGRFGLFFDDRTYEGSRPEGYYPSEESLDPDGNDIHFAVFYDYITGTSTISTCSFLVAVEDIHGGGDLDYNDMVFRIANVSVVPEPGSAALLCLALLPTLHRRRRRAA